MPPSGKAAEPFFTVDAEHTVDITDCYYAADKASLLRLPGGSCIAKGHLDVSRCFVLPKSTSLKVEAAPGTWVVKEQPRAIILPKMVNFIDDRDKCVAVFWRTVDRDAEPWVVCLRPPFDSDKMLSDEDLCAVKLNQVSSFEPIQNASGGNMLTYMNKFCKDSSAAFKHQKLGSVAAVISFASKDNTKMFLASLGQAVAEIELRIRRSQHTKRAGQKPANGRAAQEDEQAELAKNKEELKLLGKLKTALEKMVPVLELPLRNRFLRLKCKEGWESELAPLCVKTISILYSHVLPCSLLLQPRVLMPISFMYFAGVKPIPMVLQSFLSSRVLKKRSRASFRPRGKVITSHHLL